MARIAIIDLDSVMFSIAHPEKKLDENNEPVREDNKFVYLDKSLEQMHESADVIMTDILTKSEATGYIAFIKGKGNFRYTTDSEYKANRPKESPEWWAPVKKYMMLHWNAVEVNGIEVDDAVNITRLRIEDSFIYAIDNDLLGLEGTHYNWRKNAWITVDESEAEYKFWSDMITGQKGDNVKGIPGKGPRFVEKLFLNIDNVFLNINDSPSLRTLVLEEYINTFGEYEGIKQFYKNYVDLKILEDYDGFIIPEISKLNRNVEELF